METSKTQQPDHPITVSYTYQARGDGTFIAKPNKPEQWVWVAVAAKIHGVSEKTIKRWIVKRLVSGKRVGVKKWKVDLVTVDAFIEKSNAPVA